jgi:predicted nuclease of restriction endonuclease-like RecB superfamily
MSIIKNFKVRRFQKKNQRTLNEYGHRSNLETDVLRKLQRNKDILNVSYEGCSFPYTIQKNYVPDFVVRTRSGKTIYIETKGWFRPEDRTKMRAVKLSNPTVDIRLVFPRDNRLNKDSEMTYSMWCEKYGFTYHIGLNIPKRWFA